MLPGMMKVVFAGVAVGAVSTMALIASTKSKKKRSRLKPQQEAKDADAPEQPENQDEDDNDEEHEEDPAKDEEEQENQQDQEEPQQQEEEKQKNEKGWHLYKPTTTRRKRSQNASNQLDHDDAEDTSQQNCQGQQRRSTPGLSSASSSSGVQDPSEDPSAAPVAGSTNSQWQEFAESNRHEWGKSSDSLPPIGLSMLSADMGISMWKIYYEFCCKMNDLQETFLTDESINTNSLKGRHARSNTVRLTRSLRTVSAPDDTVESDLSSEISLGLARGVNNQVEFASSFPVYDVVQRERARRRCSRPKRRSCRDRKGSALITSSSAPSLPKHQSSTTSANSFLAGQIHRRALGDMRNAKRKRVKYLKCQSDQGFRVSPATLAIATGRHGQVNSELQRVCIQQIWSVWTTRKLEKFVVRRLALKRGLRAFKVNHQRCVLNKWVAQFQALWRGYQLRSQIVRHQQMMEAVKMHRMAQLMLFVWSRMIGRSFLRALAQNRRVRLEARRLICSEAEKWFVRHKKQMELFRKKEKRRKWFRMRQRKEEQLRRQMQRSIAQVDVDDLVLIVELRKWISLVMKQINVHSRVVPSTNEFLESCPRLDAILLVRKRGDTPSLPRRENSRLCASRKLCTRQWTPPDASFVALVNKFPHERLQLQHWLARCLVRTRLRLAFQLTKEKLLLASMIIQVAVKCRFAIMLLTAKYKYLAGVIKCELLIRLGSQTRAAVLIQAAWRYSRSSIQWKRYIQVCKLRLSLLSSLARRCAERAEDHQLDHAVEQFRVSLLTAKANRRVSDKLDIVAIQEFLAVLPPTGLSSSCA